MNLYHSFKVHMANALIDLDTDNFRVVLYKTIAAGISDPTLSIRSDITVSEVANGSGYLTYGKSLSTPAVTTLGSGTLSWNASDVWWSALGGPIASIKSFVVLQSNATTANSRLVAWGQLTDTGVVSITAGNRVTLQWAANGLMTAI